MRYTNDLVGRLRCFIYCLFGIFLGFKGFLEVCFGAAVIQVSREVHAVSRVFLDVGVLRQKPKQEHNTGCDNDIQDMLSKFEHFVSKWLTDCFIYYTI